MKTLSLLVVAISGGFLQGGDQSSTSDLALAAHDPVASGEVNTSRSSQSVSGIVCDTAVWCLGDPTGGERPGFIIYDLKQRYRSFTAIVGVRDENNPAKEFPSTYKITLDGRTMAHGEVRKGAEPIPIRFSVVGARSLRFELDNNAAVGNPVASRKVLSESDGGGDTPAPSGNAVRPSLLAPPADAVVSGEAANLRWKAVPEATAYAVQIVLLERTGSAEGADRRIWAETVSSGSTSYRWSLAGVPDGTYNWTVLAFKGDKVLGIFSSDRKFSVSR